MIVTMSQYNIVSVYELKKVNYEAEVLLHIACLFTFGSCLPTFVFNGVGGGLPRLPTLMMERPPFLLGLHFAIHFGSWEVLLHIACLFTFTLARFVVVRDTFIYLASMSEKLPLHSAIHFDLLEVFVAHRMFIYYSRHWLTCCIPGG